MKPYSDLTNINIFSDGTQYEPAGVKGTAPFTENIHKSAFTFLENFLLQNCYQP
jgi:hypothetical protein